MITTNGFVQSESSHLIVPGEVAPADVCVEREEGSRGSHSASAQTLPELRLPQNLSLSRSHEVTLKRDIFQGDGKPQTKLSVGCHHQHPNLTHMSNDFDDFLLQFTTNSK